MNISIAGLMAGATIGLIDCGLFMAMGLPVGGSEIASALSFWSVSGLVIFSISWPGMPFMLKGVILASLLNLPWMIDFHARGMGEMLPMVMGLALIFGLALGWASGWMARPTRRSALA